MARLVRAYRNILSIAIAHTQTEQASSPSITALTTQWACTNSAISETSEEASGKADCATSPCAKAASPVADSTAAIERLANPAGFISGFLSTQVSLFARARRLPVPRQTTRHARLQAPTPRFQSVAWGARPKPGPAFPANMSKRGLIQRICPG